MWVDVDLEGTSWRQTRREGEGRARTRSRGLLKESRLERTSVEQKLKTDGD